MDDIEKRARELLAAQFDANGPCAKTAMTAQDTYTMGALRAIIAALTPPEGFVLVPVEPTEAMLAIATGAEGLRRRLWGLMLAARPEVK